MPPRIEAIYHHAHQGCHLAYFAMVSFEGHGYYAKAAGVLFALGVFHFLITRGRHV